jgi:hypothetical protein
VVMGHRVKREGDPKLVNVYDEDSVVTFQGALTYQLLWNNDDATSIAAMQAQVVNYAYFNDTIQNQSNKTQLTPLDGEMYDPPGGDYTAAVSARYDFQIAVQGQTQEEADQMLHDLMTDYACSGKVTSSLELYRGLEPACKNVVTEPTIFVAEPITPLSAAPMRAILSNLVLGFVGAVAIILACS